MNASSTTEREIREINSTRFNLDQLQVGREAFMARLKASLETE